MNNKGTKYGIILLLLILALTGANLLFGSVNIPAEAVWHILTGNEVEKAVGVHSLGIPPAASHYRPPLRNGTRSIGTDVANHIQ